jgi:putative hemolysin
MITKNSIFIILGLCIVAGIFIAGCTQQVPIVQTPTATPTSKITASPTSAGMANPASVNCGKIGGTTEIKKNADGSEYGMCKFSNGTSCEEWALFRNEGCKAGVAVTSTTAVPVGMANPASVNCGKIGGTTEIKKNADGSEYGMCKFSNGTSCEEWALFRNEGCKANGTPVPAK